MSNIPGILISESALVATTATPQNINQIYVLGTSTSGVTNKPTAVSSATDAAAKFPGIPEIVSSSIDIIFKNNADAKVFYISAATTVATPTDTQKIQGGLEALARSVGNDLGFLVIPQMCMMTAQADRTAIFSAAETLCQKLDWIHFVNTANDSDTDAKAITERDLYSSPYGHSAIYYTLPLDTNNKKVPMAAVAAAIALKAGVINPYLPPAGGRFPITGISSYPQYVDTGTAYDTLKAKNINMVQYIPTVGYCLWLARTLASDKKFSLINTRIAISLADKQITNGVTQLLFSPSDPQGYTRREVVRVVTSILEQAYRNGGLSGLKSDDAYKIQEIEDISGDLRKVQIKVFARFVDTLELIEIQLINVDAIPA